VTRILLVEDDGEAAALVAAYLGREGFDVRVAADGPSGADAALADPPDAVVLDWMLPGFDGIEVCRRIRARSRALPVLMLTARTDDVDEIVALEVGVDDFVAKPVRPRVLLARLRALLRRTTTEQADRVDLGALTVNRARREASVEGRLVDLTTAEFDLLWALAEKAGAPVDRDALFHALRGIGYDGIDRSMDMRISQLRRKLRATHPAWDDPIRTVRGVGYQLVRP
jgi:two-component system, OmpR family, response regulator RstA